MEIEVKQAKKVQLGEIAKVYGEAFRSIGEDWNDKDLRKFVDFMYKHQPDMLYIALIDDKIVGGIWGMIKPWYIGLILSDIELFVTPKYQKKGISLYLYEKFLTEALERYGIVDLASLVDSRKEFPLEYYKSLGRKVSSFVDVYGDPKEVLKNVKKKLREREN